MWSSNQLLHPESLLYISHQFSRGAHCVFVSGDRYAKSSVFEILLLFRFVVTRRTYVLGGGRRGDGTKSFWLQPRQGVRLKLISLQGM